METEFSLIDSEIYNKTLPHSQSMVEEQFKKLTIEYFEFINRDEKKIIAPTTEIFKYVVIKGLEAIGHVFKMVLMYTNNLSAAIYHSQRSICLYIELILQIIENSQTFLKLTTRDAILYVYKETIFRLKKETSSFNMNISYTEPEQQDKTPIKEKIDTVLYSAVEYIQNNTCNPEITQQDISNVVLLITHV